MFYFFVLILSICALVYEFLLSTLSSYLIGNSVLQFSLTIGLFLSGLGVGSFLSRFVKSPSKLFFFSEMCLGIVGGFSVFIIKFLYIYFFNYLIIFYVFYFLIVLFIGSLVGFEIPILGNLSALQKNKTSNEIGFKNIISDVFTYDYIGALGATFLFPFVLLPWLGLTYTALFLGLFNLLIALIFIHEKTIKSVLLTEKCFYKFKISGIGILIIYILLAVLVKSNFESFWDHFFYKEPVVFHKQTKYQDIVITQRDNDIRLLLDGHLQFLSLDEKRYHDGLWAIPESLLSGNLNNRSCLLYTSEAETVPQ